MLILDVWLRYSTVTMLFLIAILAMRDGRKFPPTLYMILTSVTVAFMLLGTAPDALRLPEPLHVLVRFADIGNIVFIWWLGLAIFQDGFRLRWPHWAVLILNCAVLLPSRWAEIQQQAYFYPVLNYGLDLVTFGIMGHLVFVTLKGRADDLIDARRALRLYFVVAMIIATLAAIMAENILAASHPEFLQTLRCIIIFPVALWAVLWLTEMHLEKVIFEAQKPAHDPAHDIDPEESRTVDPRDQTLLADLRRAMEVDTVYTEPKLTIRKLSEILNAPEHRLRSLINQGLGYRNFSSFLNQYRIEAIKAALAEPSHARTPVLTIALDYGYNSLAPFNRAFREIEGMTPSDYRRSLSALSSPKNTQSASI